MQPVWTAARHEFHRPLQQPRRHPPGVPQQRRIGGVMDVGFHDSRIGADDVRADHFLRNPILAKQFVDPFPGFRLDGQEALVEERVVHHRSFPHPRELLEEQIAADADDRIAEGQTFEVLDDQRAENVFGGVVALASLGVAFGEFQKVRVDQRENLGIVVEDLTDGAVSVTIVAYDLGQAIVIGLETQHGFLLSTHPCSPSWSLNNHEDKDASFFIKLDRAKPTQNPFRNRN